MDKENIAHLHNGVIIQLFFFNDMKFSDKRIEIETTVIPSEVTQTLGDKYGMYSIISGY